MTTISALGHSVLPPPNLTQVMQRYLPVETLNVTAPVAKDAKGRALARASTINTVAFVGMVSAAATGLNGTEILAVNSPEKWLCFNCVPEGAARLSASFSSATPAATGAAARGGVHVKLQPYRAFDAAWQAERLRVVQELGRRAAKADLETDNERNLVQVAIREASSFIQKIDWREMPSVNITDDGVAVLVWRTETKGVALVFSGDGTLTLSQQRPGRAYVDEHEEACVDDNATCARVTELLDELLEV